MNLPAPAHSKPSDNQLKVLYILNFLKFTKWTSLDKETLSLCYIDDSDFSELISSVSGKVVQGRSIQLNRITKIDELEGCNVLYISPQPPIDRPQLASECQRLNILDIGNDKYTELGGVMSFMIINNKLRFNINLTQAKQRGIQLSSSLLELAHSIHH